MNADQQLMKLIYASRSIKDLTSDDVERILDGANQKNNRLNITGALIYINGIFIQILEGPRANVSSVFNSICHDARHFDLQVIYVDELVNRQFSDWSLKYIQIDKLLTDGYGTLNFYDLDKKYCMELLDKYAN